MVAAHRPAPARMRGFTLIEGLLVLTLIAVLAAIAVPGLRSLTTSQEVKSAAMDIVTALSYARSEALTRNANITVAPVGGNWANGWRVSDPGGTVLQRQDSYRWVQIAGPGSLTFNGSGRPDVTTTPFAFSPTVSETTTQRCVRVNLSGRAYVRNEACS